MPHRQIGLYPHKRILQRLRKWTPARKIRNVIHLPNWEHVRRYYLRLIIARGHHWFLRDFNGLFWLDVTQHNLLERNVRFEEVLLCFGGFVQVKLTDYLQVTLVFVCVEGFVAEIVRFFEIYLLVLYNDIFMWSLLAHTCLSPSLVDSLLTQKIITRVVIMNIVLVIMILFAILYLNSNIGHYQRCVAQLLTLILSPVF